MKTKKIVGIRVVAPGSDPDVDSDFNTMVREHAIEYVRDQYHNVASIVTFNTLKAAKAFKAMCTIYEVPFAAANKVSGLIPKPIEGVDCTISDLFDPSSDRYSEGVDFRNATAGDEWTKILKGAMAIENRNDSHGVHPCGIVISSQPLENVIPTHVRQSDGAVITQWHYSDLESMGLIKMDFLGLDTVDLIQHSVENVMALGKTPPNMVKLVHGPMDDKKTFELFSKGDTIGIFQMAGDGVRDLLRRIKPDDVEDIIATTALYRPGPMGMQSHTKYAARKNGQESFDYPVHPDFKGSALEGILAKTYGLCVPVGTKILNSNTGQFVAIENIVDDGSFFTPSLSADAEVQNKPVEKLIHTGEKEVVRIAVNGGRTLTVATTHPVLTSRGYVEAGELKAGDLIASSAHKKILAPAGTKNEDLAWFLGLMLGDGSITGDASPYFTNSEHEIREAAKHIATTHFENIRIHETPRLRDGVEYTRHIGMPLTDSQTGKYDRSQTDKAVDRHPIVSWLRDLGYEGKVHTRDKSITDAVFGQMNDVELASLLAGLWDTDGHVSSNGVHFTTISEGLYKTVQLALQRLGIDYSVSVGDYSNSKREDASAYRVFPTREDFARSIQPLMRSSRKRDFVLDSTAANKASMLFPLLLEDANEFFAAHPAEIDTLTARMKNTYREQGVTPGVLASYISRKLDREIGKSYSATLSAMIELSMLSDETLAATSLRYRKIESIDSLGLRDCYDIEVADNHSFFVEGFVTHNCVYQEQIIKIASEIAGMTLQEGDDLRKAMGKKKVAVMDKMRPKFFEGAKANGFSEAAVTELWDTIAEFAKYGFNRSHSVAYGINAYQAGYLKANYPVEFMAALIAQHVNNREKTLAHLQEAGRMGLRIGPADVNKSVTRVAPVADDPKYDILFGLGGVNSVSEDNADLIVKERTENGDFKSPQDFVRRMFNLGITNRRVFENIALAGGFDRMGFSRKGIVDALSDLIAGAKTTATKGASLFDLFGDADEMDSVAVKISNEMYPHVDMLKAEANVMGLYLSGHPLERARASLSASTDVHSIKELHSSSRSVQMTIVGAITNIETKIQRRGGKRITVSIDDGSGYLNANLHGSVVKAMDKLSAQTSVRRLWEKGATEISEELLAAAVNPEVTLPLEEIEKNDVYVMQVSYRPATELSDYYCRVDSIRKLRLSDDGTLPIRLRIMEKFRSEAGKLSAAIANASPGESEIWAAMIDGSELPLVIPNDEAYLQAGEEIRTGKAVLKESASEKGARKITRIDGSVTEAKKKGRGAAKAATPSNVWPPKGTEETTTLKIRAKADELYFFAADQLNYSVSKRTASASVAVLPIADKIVGREGIDFGFATPVMFSDKD